MTPFPRQPAPDFWTAKERAWLDRIRVEVGTEFRWPVHRERLLSAWFHELVRPAREPRLCAYCDGELGATSPPSIDHFVPVSRDRALALAWANLYPTCTTCNTVHKRDQWVPEMVRPDVDAVVGWFSVNWKGEVEPSRSLDAATRARVSRTIEVLGLNVKARCIARRQVMQRAIELGDAIEAEPARRLARLKRLLKLLRSGPYRFAVRQVVAARIGAGAAT